MAKKSKSQQVAEHPRIWHDLAECKIDDTLLIKQLNEGTPEAAADIIQNYLNPNEYLSVRTIPSENTAPLQDYIEKLREAGLDVGKGDCEYGYRMPHVKRDERLATELHIFRRR